MARGSGPLLCCRLALFVSIAMRRYDVTAVPCNFVTSNDRVELEAQCSHRRMTRFPGNLPNNVLSLDVSYNFLSSLGGLADRQLANLRDLDVSHNLLTSLPADVFRHVPQLQVLNLGHNALVTLNDDVFRGLTNLTSLVLTNTNLLELSPMVLSHVTTLVSLDLSSNVLQVVPTAALQHASRLEWLDLSNTALQTVSNDSLSPLQNLRQLNLHHNRLVGLQPAAFSGLQKLVMLDLGFNSLELSNTAYPSGVFSPFVALQSLSLNGNDFRNYGDYPLNVFDPLRSLRTLFLDTFSEPLFGTAFTSLTRLTTLSLTDDGCLMKLISNDTFSAFRHSGLQTLTILGCPLLHVDSCAFCHLPRLTSLSVDGQDYLHLSYLLMALYGLQNQTLKLVDFSNNKRRYGVPTILDETNTQYLNNVCIEKLELRENGIVGVSSRAFQVNSRFVECVKHVDLSLNAISQGSYSLFMRLAFGLAKIESIEVQNQRAFRLGEYARSGDDSPQSDIVLHLNFPRSLRLLNVSRGIQDLSQLPLHVDFPQAGNLSELDLSYCSAYYCNISVTGLTSIHTLDVSGNNCTTLGDHVFRHMTTLRRLRVADLLLKEEFLFTNGTELLRPLVELEELDLSDNHLNDLPDNLLRYQPRLQRLVLARNGFQAVPVDVLSLAALSDLDLTDNLIHTLPLHHRQALDRLAASHTLTVRLRGNPLTCTCEALDMVRWLADTVVRLDGDNHNEGYDDDYDDNGRDYPCVLEDGSMSSTGSVMAQWDTHWRRCVGLAFLTVSAVALLVQLLALLLTYLLWSKWTYMRHAWRVLRHLRLPHRNDFVHDALFVHVDDDLEVAMKVKQCVHRLAPDLRLTLTEEQIRPGSFYAEEIAKCIERSWKVVLLVTQTFLQDDWSGFTVVLAQGSISDTMPDRVLLLCLGPLRPGPLRVPTHVSMKRLLRMVPESSVYHVPGDVTARHPLWASLAHDIARDTG